MARAGLPVPPAFVVTTEACRAFYAADGRFPEGLDNLIDAQIRRLESETCRNFNGTRRPLIVSVRSGAPVSMPGMLETVLDVGLNDVTVRALMRQRGNPRLAWDCYRRFVESYTQTVACHELSPFARLANALFLREGVTSTRELDALAQRELLQQSPPPEVEPSAANGGGVIELGERLLVNSIRRENERREGPQRFAMPEASQHGIQLPPIRSLAQEIHVEAVDAGSGKRRRWLGLISCIVGTTLGWSVLDAPGLAHHEPPAAPAEVQSVWRHG